MSATSSQLPSPRVVIAVLAGFVLLQQYFLLTRSWCPKCDCPKPEHVKSDFAAKRFVAKPPQQPLQQPSVQHLDTLPRPVVEHKPAPPTTVLTTTPAVLKPRFAPDLKPLKIYQPYAACYGFACWPFIYLEKNNIKPDEVLCDGRCSYLGFNKGAHLSREADVVVWDILRELPNAQSGKRADQRYIGFFWESPSNYPVIKDQNAMNVFDFEMSYRPIAAIGLAMYISDTTGDFSVIKDWPIMSFEVKKKNPMLTAWISNCGVSTNGRIQTLQGLIDAGVSARNYGGCRLRGETNTEPFLDQEFIDKNPIWKSIQERKFQIPGAQPITVGYETFLKGGASLFFFGAENSNCDFYHTEKAYKGLLAGSIPIYIGADTAKTHGYFPEKSVLFFSDYKSPKELADHMLQIASNSSLYDEYMAWRYKPIPPVLKQRLDHALSQRSMKGFCGMCDFLRENWNNKSWAFKAQEHKGC